MNQEITFFLIGQAVLITITAGGAFLGISVKLAALRADVSHYAAQRQESLDRLVELSRQVQGISRSVERHDTLLEEQVLPTLALYEAPGRRR